MYRTACASLVFVLSVVAVAFDANANSNGVLVTNPASVSIMNAGLGAGWQIDLAVEQVPGQPNPMALQHTVIDVFAAPEGRLVAEARSTATVPASLHLGPYLDDRIMWAVIRSDQQIDTLFGVVIHMTAYAPSSTEPSSEGSYEFVVQNTAEANVVPPNGLVANTHIMTGLQPGGSNDTLVMVLANGAAVQADDDNGPGMASWLHLFALPDGTSPCALPGTCSIYVAHVAGVKVITSPTHGTWSSSLALGAPAKVYWDEDVHNGRDADQDGLGDALEQVLGTHWKGRFADGTDCPSDPGDTDDINGCKDTDRDGIPDVLEVLGKADAPANEENPWNLLMFPAYGADPTQKDVFVETHWGPGCLGVGCANKLINQFNSGQVAEIQKRWNPIRIHVDAGNSQCLPADACGDWGGAYMYPDGYAAKSYCDGFSPERQPYFHHMLSAGGNQTSGGCSFVTNHNTVGNPAHELGHQFGLQHYGGPGALDQIGGCKPHYVSIMNYVYSDYAGMGSVVPGFSLGLNNFILNPKWLDETASSGLSTQYPYGTALLDQFGRVSSSAGVDWNFDGEITTSGTVVGPVNYPRNYVLCDRETSAVRQGAWMMQAQDPILVTANGQLWLVGRYDDATNGTSGFFASAATIHCDTVPGSLNCTDWSQRVGIPASVSVAAHPPAAAGDILAFVHDGGSGGELYFITQPPWQGVTTPSTALPADPSGTSPRIWGDPVATVDPATNVVSVYAASGATAAGPHHLARWDYDPRLPGWTRLGEVQLYDNGNPVEVFNGLGPAITRGYQQGGLDSREAQGEFVYIMLSVPVADPKVVRKTTVLRQVTATWTNPVAQYWAALPDALMADLAAALVAPSVMPSGRVGFAFRPEPTASDPPGFVNGRFYMTFLGLGTLGQTHEPWFTFTQGNTFWDGVAPRPASHEMVFVSYNNFANEWSDWPNGGIFVTYFNGNLRGAAQTDIPVTIPEVFDPNHDVRLAPPNISFFPNADGVVNMDQHDYNDQEQIVRSLQCSLSRTCP
jgi:hypothetical protein